MAPSRPYALAVIDADRVLDGLNPEQREAAQTVHGPVVILAGAGTGKTTTITRRIAYQVATGTFAASSLLAVAFTRKARTEMRQRLDGFGIIGVNVQTIHAAAFQQLRSNGSSLPEVLTDANKHELLKSVIEKVAPEQSFVYRKDLITTIERAKGSGITPSGFERAARNWQLALDADVMARIYAEYERQKGRTGRIDFEDMQSLALEAMRSEPERADRFRQRIHAITVDEFQDVSSVQVQLVEAWLGGRDEICVVGDDYQSIYGFRGGSPEFLLTWERRFTSAKRVTLESNYRSSPQILEFANRLVPALGGFAKTLRPTRPEGPQPALREMSNERAFIVQTIRTLHTSERVPFEQMALLVRVHRATAEFEEALAEARIPYRVEEGGFLQRPAIAAALRALRASADRVAPAVRNAVAAGGLRPGEASEGQHVQDLALLSEIADEFAATHAEATATDFVADLEERFTQRDDAAAGRGVRMMTYHDAKGLEFDAVFLPRLVEGELPFRSRRVEAPRDEERRLLYVGITRARKYLFVTRSGAPSLFWRELEPRRLQDVVRPHSSSAQPAAMQKSDAVEVSMTGSLLDVLKRWREVLYKRPRFSTFSDSELASIAEAMPTDKDALRSVLSSESKADKYAAELLDLVARKGAAG